MSHRIRRQPSIFSTPWFRGLLGAGLAMIVALLVAPSIAGWFGSELPQSLFPVLPWGGSAQSADQRAPAGESTAAISGPGTAALPVSREPSALRSAPGGTPAPPAARSEPVARAGADRSPGDRPAAAGSQSASARTQSAAASPRPGAGTAAPGDPAAPHGERLGAPPTKYWVQVGAFLDHRNADRLAERLRGEGLAVGTTAFEQSRVLYRVLLAGADGGGVADDVVERARGLGHAIEATPDGPAVGGPVPLRRAVETSQTLRKQGVSVRLKQSVSSATYRVVRVGSFPTSGEAEAALAALAGRGIEGVVVRER